MEVITKSGFTCEVDPKKLDDWEILDMLSDLESGNMLTAPRFVKKVLGPEKAKELVEHCREENGTVPTKKVLTEIFEIFGALKDGKN